MSRPRLVEALCLVVAVLASGMAVAAAPGDPCDGLHHVAVEGLPVLCTHGPDPVPGSRAGATADRAASAVPSRAPQCYDDGRSGRRVAVLHVHADDMPAGGDVARLRHWAGQVEWTFNASAARNGGAERYVRWVTEAGADDDCQIAIIDAPVPAEALDDFTETVRAVTRLGHARSDRKYLMFVEASVGICGLAIAPGDDRASADNRANTEVGYGRVDSQCWASGDEGHYSVAAHELTHMLGGVQASAPHGTQDRHCTDEWDVMCYADGAGEGVEIVCRDARSDTSGAGDDNNRLLDCGGDDYFHAGQPSGYLANHWNVAQSAFLASRTGAGPGYEAPRVAGPLRGILWSGGLGVHRPVLASGRGFDPCTLPLQVAVADDMGVVGLVRSSSESVSGAVASFVPWVNNAASTTVLEVAPDGGPVDIVVSANPVPGPEGASPVDVTLTTSLDGFIAAAHVTVDEPLPGESGTRIGARVEQGLAQSLGLGRDGTVGTLLSPWVVDGVDRSVAGRVLRHLYGPGACGEDHRLLDLVPGHASQRRADSTRRRLDIVPTADGPIDAAVQVAEWTTERFGSGWADLGVVCRDDVAADCLGGAALAADGPVVFVPGGRRGRLPAAVARALAGAVRPGGTVYVLGGTGAVSTSVEDELRAVLPAHQVVRLAGADRNQTATLIADEVVARQGLARPEPGTPVRPNRPVALLVRSGRSLDAAVAGAFAAAERVPVLLTNGDALAGTTRTWLREHPGRVLVVGGPDAISAAVLDDVRFVSPMLARVLGDDAIELSAALARHRHAWDQRSVNGSAGMVGVAGSGPNAWNVALATTSLAARFDSPVLVLRAGQVPTVVERHLGDLPVSGAVDLTTITVAAGRLQPATVERFHAAALPGLDGNLRRL